MISDFFSDFIKLQTVSCHFVACCICAVEERARHELQNFVSVRSQKITPPPSDPPHCTKFAWIAGGES